MWQDFVFLFGGFIGAGILLPTLYDENSTIPLKTSVLQIGLISIFSFTFWTLAMPLSAAGASLRVAMWVGIAALRNERGGISVFEASTHDCKRLPSEED